MFTRKTVQPLLAEVRARLGLVVCLLTLALLAAPIPIAHAAIITVNSSGDGVATPGNCPGAGCRLRDAIAKANPGDTIRFNTSVTLIKLNPLQGQLLISKDLSIGPSSLVNEVFVDALGNSRVFDISSGATVNISNMGIVNGSVSGQNGGGIRVQGGTALNLSNVSIQDNKVTGGSDDGGAIYNAGVMTLANFAFLSGNTATNNGGAIHNNGFATITGDLYPDGSRSIWFFGNSSAFDGGAIYNNGTLTVTNTLINNGGATNAGGAIANNALLTLEHSLITGNNASNGAGIDNRLASSTLTIVDSTISTNTASNPGGGISNSGTLTIHRSTVSGNSTAFEGGGITNDGTLTMINSTVSGNFAKNDGGGIWNVLVSSTINLNNVTISDNTADSDANGTGNGGGIFNSGTVNVKNTIIAANKDSSPVTKHPDCSGALTSQGYNLLRINTGCSGLTDGVNGDQVGTSGSPLNALLGSLASNGGPTQTHALLPASPAIDKGNPATPGSGSGACAAYDQRSYPRGAGAGRCDIGAFERVFLNFLPLITR